MLLQHTITTYFISIPLTISERAFSEVKSRRLWLYKSYTFHTLPAQKIFKVLFPTHFSSFHLMETNKVGKTKESCSIRRMHYVFTPYNATVGRPRTGLRIPAGARFSLLHSAQCGYGAHPAHDPMCDGYFVRE